MDKWLKKKWIEAIDLLERHYKGEDCLDGDCPLCDITLHCNYCLWRLIEGMSCVSMRSHLGYQRPVNTIRNKRYKRWVTMRLKQLPEWKEWVSKQ